MFANFERKSATATGCLVAFGLLATSISAAARDGTMPFDTVACRDKGIIQGFADRMRETMPDQFWMYVDGLIRTGPVRKDFPGRAGRIHPAERRRAPACRSAANERCFWSVAQTRTLAAPAIAARTEPSTTGQAAPPETTGSVAPRGQTTTIVRTTTTIVRPGERPVTTTETTRTTR